ncbi:hypothetical protein ACROYT_G033209 [Oculina patagonica]
MDVEVLKPVIASQRNAKKETKKSKKPLMEKMRRARINDSLNELKSLVLEAMKKDVSRYSKMEKADILEMTVKYLRSLNAERPLHLKQHQDDAVAIAKYRAGFNECAAKVSQFLMTADNITVPVRTQLLSHLATTCQKQKEPHQLPNEQPASRQQTHIPLSMPSSFPAISPAVGGNPAFTDGSMATKFPSPPSSPLRSHQERKLLPFSPAISPSMSPFVLSNGIPALILPNDTAVQLLPLTLPNSSSAFDTSLWRPW